MICVNGCKECTGCGACTEQKPVYTDVDGVAIYEGEPYYIIAGDIYSEDTLKEFRQLA